MCRWTRDHDGRLCLAQGAPGAYQQHQGQAATLAPAARLGSRRRNWPHQQCCWTHRVSACAGQLCVCACMWMALTMRAMQPWHITRSSPFRLHSSSLEDGSGGPQGAAASGAQPGAQVSAPGASDLDSEPAAAPAAVDSTRAAPPTGQQQPSVILEVELSSMSPSAVERQLQDAQQAAERNREWERRLGPADGDG